MESFSPTISFSDIFTGAMFLVALYWVFWRSSKSEAEMAECRGKTETRLDGFEKSAETIEATVKGVRDDVGTLKSKVASMQSDIKWLINSNTTSLSRDEKTITGASPLTLNKRGVELAESLDAFNTAKALASKISVSANADPFEIQAAAYHYSLVELMGAIDEKTRKKIQALAYEDEGDLSSILRIYAVLLRNEILKSRDMKIPPYPKPKNRNF